MFNVVEHCLTVVPLLLLILGYTHIVLDCFFYIQIHCKIKVHFLFFHYKQQEMQTVTARRVQYVHKCGFIFVS